VLREFSNLRQVPGTYRRLFEDDYFELYPWYDRRWGRLLGFQLVYDKYGDCHALTWTQREGYEHHSVPNADDAGGLKGTPLLMPDGSVDCIALAERFLQSSSHLPRMLREFVHRAILRYGHCGDRCEGER
jgi:hypothetical protein